MKPARILVWLALGSASCLGCSEPFQSLPPEDTHRAEGSEVSAPETRSPLQSADAAAPTSGSDTSASPPTSASDASVSVCVPQTCAAVQAECGTTADGCGGTLECGECAAPFTCGTETANRCSCTPTTCAAEQAQCGAIPDGCNGTLLCGSCESGAGCGLLTPNRCDVLPCVPTTCSDVGATCGPLMDGCGHPLDCGKCEKDFECIDQQCVCKPDKCDEHSDGGTSGGPGPG